MSSKWSRGHIGRFWEPSDYKNFNYVRQPLMDSEIQEWKNKGYDYVKSFSGSMYDNRNPMPEWVNRFDKIFNLKNLTYNFYKMSQLEIMPEHVDHFQTYMKLFNVEYKNVRRILVMLDDWKPGHYLEVDGVGVVNWIAGDYFIWDSDVRHAASNIGTEDRYTLQITGTVITHEDVYKKLHWYNIPGLESKKESIHSPEMAVMKQRMDNGKPYMIYMYNQDIVELENITHDADTIQYLNTNGLDIYLYEPLCSYIAGSPQLYPPYGTKHSLVFYSEFNYDQVQDRTKLRADELNSIELYVKKNKLSNVTVRACDFDIDKWYPNYQPEIKLVTDDLFLKHFDIKEFDEVDGTSSDFTKKFICMNWRYTPHRQLVAAYLSNFSDTYMTWYFKSDLSNIAKEPWYNLYNWQLNHSELYDKIIVGLAKLNAAAPRNVDLDVKDATIISHPYLKNTLPTGIIYDHKLQKYGINQDKLGMYYNDVFCDIVNESRFAQPTGNFSEKVYRPMFYKKPFIMVGPPHTLHYMHGCGFKTFGDFWDESYDSMEDHEQRLFAIFKVIDKINAMSIDDLKYFYEKMTPIIEHNKKRLLENIQNIKPWLNT